MEPWFRRAGVTSALAAFLWATWRVFGDSPPDIPAGTATAYGTLLGAGLTAWLGFYWRSKGKDDD